MAQQVIRHRLAAVVISTVLAMASACVGGSDNATPSDTTVKAPVATIVVPSVTDRHALAVSPSDGLVDGNTLRVWGRDFPNGDPTGDPVATVVVIECRAGATAGSAGRDCDPATQQYSVGTQLLDFVFVARRGLTLPDGALDCADGPGCVVLAHGRTDQVYGVAPVRFDPAKPRKGPARLEVAPSPDPRGGQHVSVTVSNAYANSDVMLSLCRADGPACAVAIGTVEDPLGAIRPYGKVAEDGTLSYDGTARAYGFSRDATGAYRPFECVTAPGCVVRAAIGDEPVLSVPLAFAGDGPVRNPQLMLEPPSPLADGQSVTVRLRGFPSNLTLFVAQCAPSSGLSVCASAQTVETGEDGTDDVSVTVHRQPTWPPASGLGSIDCSIPGHCTIAVHPQPGMSETPGIQTLLEIPVVVTN